ncbi:MAG: acetoacetyl-CoA synthetase [Thermoleophilaceae bacterium]|nr:acetoacetyl-CoA synthetase [Thermoleophilaceae bacterium]
MRFCESATGRGFADQAAFHEFSIEDQRGFWRLLLEWSGLNVEGSPEPACTDDRCEHATFFPDLRLNYAECLLEGAPDRPALSAHHAEGPPDRLTRGELRERVLAVAGGLREIGIGRGDRVAAVAGNNAEAVVAALACATVGAACSTASPDMGTPAVLSRFEQLAPKLLMATLAGAGTPAAGDPAERAAEVAARLPSLTAFVALDDGPVPPGIAVPVHRLSEMHGHGAGFERLPFNQPLFVLFTSGTTGRPKCVVHGAGGTLLEHVKEHRLHADLRPKERLFFHTSAGWMMWQWQLSALASGAEIVLYDGPIADPSTLWRIVAAERVEVFGTSPPYLQLCEDSGYSPRREVGLTALRAVLSTGSILHDWQYDWVAEHVGPLPLQSISGGTDIIGCFVLGSPNLPVRPGWLQCRSLGMDVQALDGELVCRNPFPSRPLHLLGDDGTRFHETYFARNPGVWTHGDLIEFDDDGHARMHGRSDGVMNVHGLRIGPAEIYRALREVPEVHEAMAVERNDRMVLLVVLRDRAELDGRLSVRIRREIARATSPLHVPELVVQVDELPTTHSGKRSERAAHDVLNGVAGTNTAALANPGSLAAIEQAVEAAVSERPSVPALEGSTEARLRAIWESVLGIAPLRPDDNFFDLGGTSLAALRLLEAIHEHMGIDLPLSILLDAPTTAAMARAVDEPAEMRSNPLVLLRAGTGERPLFLVHSLFGDVLSMRPLALALETERPVYGLQARGLDASEQPHRRVEDMADCYLASVLGVQPAGPYALAGHSLGGLVAFEMARRLVARGEEVEWLGLIDCELPHDCLPAPQRLRWLARRSSGAVRAACADPRTQVPRYARRAALALAGRSPPPPPPPLVASTLPPLMRRLEQAGWEAFRAFRPSPYPGSATFFRADTRSGRMGNPLPVWRRVVEGGLTVETVPGIHRDVVAEPNVGALAERTSPHLTASASGQRSRHS